MLFVALKWTILPILLVIVVMVISALLDSRQSEEKIPVFVRTGPALARLPEAELLAIRDEMARSLRRQGKESAAVVFENYTTDEFRYFLDRR